MNIAFRSAVKKDAGVISKLAEEIWWPTYSSIIPSEQISFMLNDMYSVDSLLNQMEEGTHFIILEVNGIDHGFAGFSYPNEEGIFRIHKLYLHPSEQGKGLGKKLVDEALSIAIQNNATTAELNVNRANPAFEFYKKLGFEIYQKVDIPYHQFVLNDYVMRKNLS